MGITIEGTDAISKVTFVVTRAYDAKKDGGPDRRRVKESATTFLDTVVGKVVSVTHGLEGARSNRSAWTLVAEMRNLALMTGADRRKVVSTLKKSAQAWATKNVGRGAKVALSIG